MAQKVNIVLIDDIDESAAVETVSFGLDGKDYSIDLSAKNARRLREALAPFVGHARREGGSTGARRRRTSAQRGNAAEVRAWARDNGYDVPDRGRIPAEINSAYAAAH